MIDWHSSSAESSIADIFLLIGRNLQLSQTLFRKGRVYRAFPNPERKAQKATEGALVRLYCLFSSRLMRCVAAGLFCGRPVSTGIAGES